MLGCRSAAPRVRRLTSASSDCVATRPNVSKHAKYAAAVTSNARQNAGHHVGALASAATAAWKAVEYAVCGEAHDHDPEIAAAAP